MNLVYTQSILIQQTMTLIFRWKLKMIYVRTGLLNSYSQQLGGEAYHQYLLLSLLVSHPAPWAIQVRLVFTP